jgi:hypothetical protein
VDEAREAGFVFAAPRFSAARMGIVITGLQKRTPSVQY